MVSRREALRRMSGLAAGAAAMGCTGDAVPNEGAGAASTAGTASTAGAATGESGTTALGPLGLQLYTVRSEMENGVEQTLERVAAIGYQEVEFAGYFGHSPAEIRGMLARTGLRSPATHIALAVETALARILDDANTIGHEYLVVPSIPQSLRADLDGWRRTAATLTGAGEQARAAGLQYAYHNHDFEFIEMDGRVAFDVFCEESDPELVKIELDLFWIIHGGGRPRRVLQPVAWPGPAGTREGSHCGGRNGGCGCRCH